MGLFQSTKWTRWLVFIGIFQFQLRATFRRPTREKMHSPKKSSIEMDPSTSVRRPLQDVTNGDMPLPYGLLRAIAQTCLYPSPLAMPQAAVVAHLEPQHQQTAALSAVQLSASACRRNWRLVRGSARASLARQSWMPCGCIGRPRLAPASASS